MTKVTLVIFALALFASAAFGQGTTPPATQQTKPAESISVKADEAVAILKLQRDKASAVITLQQLKSQWDQVVAQRDAADKAMSDWVVDVAARQKIDLSKYYFDADALQFKLRPPSEKKPDK